jgi:lipopolysaccharide transport system ATP-binding protein
LLPGSYNVRAHVMDSEGVRMFDTLERGLNIRGASREFGLIRLPHRWPGAPGDARD